jgi:hypothetical protein
MKGHLRAKRNQIRPYPLNQQWLRKILFHPNLWKELWNSWERPLERLAKQNATKLIRNCMTLLSSDQYQSPSMIYPYNQDRIGSPNRLKMFLDRLHTTGFYEKRKEWKLKDRLGPPVKPLHGKTLDARQIIDRIKAGSLSKAGPQNKAGPQEAIQKHPTSPQLHQFPSSDRAEENLLNEDPIDYYFE